MAALVGRTAAGELVTVATTAQAEDILQQLADIQTGVDDIKTHLGI